MSLVTVPQVNPNDEVTALSVNQGPNAIAAVLNGNIDDSNVSTISGAKVTSGSLAASSLNDSGNIEKFRQEANIAFVQSGLIWSTLTGLDATMSAGILYSTNGSRIPVALIASQTFTASRDTYVSVSPTGTIQLSPVTNGAAIPTLAAGYVPLAEVITNGTTITSIIDMRQTSLLPTTWLNWTPTWTGLTPTNATVTAKYTKTGKIVKFRLTLVWTGSPSIPGPVTFSLPSVGATYVGSTPVIGSGSILDAGSAIYSAVAVYNSTTTVQIRAVNSATTYASFTQLSSTIPMTWVATDELYIEGEYEEL